MTSLPIFPVAPVIRIVCFFSLSLANFSIHLPLCLIFEISYQDNLLNTIDRYMLDASHSPDLGIILETVTDFNCTAA